MEIVINADDFGISHEVNLAVQYCLEKKIIHRTSLMVNMPYAEEAVAFIKEKGLDDYIGLHLNLVEGMPLTEEIRKTQFCDKNGIFNGLIMKGSNRFFLTKKELLVVEKEIEAQINKYLSFGIKCSHIDSHRHAHTNYPILTILLNQVKNVNGCGIRLSRNMPKESLNGIKGIYKKIINKSINNYNVQHGALVIDYFGQISDFEMLELEQDLQNDRIEIMIHPIMRNDNLADAINNFSIENWLNEREEICESF